MNPDLPEAGGYPTSLQAQAPGFVPHKPVTHGSQRDLLIAFIAQLNGRTFQLAHVTADVVMSTLVLATSVYIDSSACYSPLNSLRKASSCGG